MTSRAAFDPRAYVDPRPRPWVIHTLGAINRHVMLPHVLHLRAIDFPPADLRRLRSAVRPGTAAFLGPVHPEFTTDWLLDKEISRRVSPLMAHWAAYDIVNASPRMQAFWLANNLISNAPGGGGKAYSLRWALAGHGVLLHPEGGVTWQAERTDALVPGIVDMAWRACEQSRASGGMPVFVVPMVWRLHFTGDVSRGLAREMALIERALALPSGAGTTVEHRFAALHVHLLRARVCALELTAPDAGDYFDAQAMTITALRHALEARHGPVDGDVPRVVHHLRRAVRNAATADPDTARLDRRRVDELERLHRFTPELYGRPTLTQEQMAESLKRIRLTLVTRGFRNGLHNQVPVAVGARVAKLRVPDPIAVHERFTPDPDEGARTQAALLVELRRRMQHSLDAIGEEIAPVIDRFRWPNPLAVRSSSARGTPTASLAGV